MTGYVTNQERAALYRAAAALVYPSFAEGFGLPILEAMASGTPVITSNVSSMPEVAGDAALLVDPLDTSAIAAGMATVLQPEVAHRLRSAGLKRVAQFSWKTSAERLLAALRKADSAESAATWMQLQGAAG